MRRPARIVSVVVLAGVSTVLTVAPLDAALSPVSNVTVSNDPNQAGAIVTYASPATSAPDSTATCSPASGSFFALGTTTVTCNGNGGGTTSFTVTVNDNQPPTLTAPANQSVAAPPGATGVVVNYPAPVATDNAPGVTSACNPPSGSVFPVGTTVVSCTATDGAGNTATATFNVTVTGTPGPATNPVTVNPGAASTAPRAQVATPTFTG